MPGYELPASLVVEPAAGAAQLAEALDRLGWRLAAPGAWSHAEAASPLRVEADDAGHTVLRCADVTPAGRAALAGALPVIGVPEAVLALDSRDPARRRLALEVLRVAEAVDSLFEVQALRGDRVPEVAEAARRAGRELTAAAAARDLRRIGAVFVVQAAEAVLWSLAADPGRVRALRPSIDDAVALFVSAVARGAGERIVARWAVAPPRFAPGPDLERIDVRAATGTDLRAPHPDTAWFPAGWRDAAPWLRLDATVVAWRFAPPPPDGPEIGAGLVWTGDRFAWFPDPQAGSPTARANASSST